MELFVLPAGDDGNPGTEAKPFRSLPRARDAVRTAMRDGSLTEPAFVRQLPGVHRIEEPLTLKPEDSGSADCPVTCTGHGDGKAVIDGGRRITGWRRAGELWVTDLPRVKSKLRKGYQPRNAW